MAVKPPTIRIGIYGNDNTPKNEKHGCGLWKAGYVACLEQAEAVPVILEPEDDSDWPQLLETIHGVLLIGHDNDERRGLAFADSLCRYCRENDIPILGVDHGMHLLNQANFGTIHQDVGREVPEALQHRHPPERGLRHAINVVPGTRLADIYGEGEIVVNSEHRRAVCKLGRGFKVGATALDGVIESIESINEDWFAMGVQWHPASPTASGLDIQVFRALVEAALRRTELVGAAA